MNIKSKYKQFLFRPDRSMGYNGSKEIIRVMSSFEWKTIQFLIQLFKAGRIKGWVCEESIFEYKYTLDSRIHKYYMDFTIEMPNGDITFVEVKPSAETKPPLKPKKGNTEYYQNAVRTFIKNQDKWKAVRDYCLHESTEQKKYRFVIWDEYTLKIK